MQTDEIGYLAPTTGAAFGSWEEVADDAAPKATRGTSR